MLPEICQLTHVFWDLHVDQCFLNLQVGPCYLVDRRYLRSSSWLPIWPMHATWDLLVDLCHLVDPCYLRSASWTLLPEIYKLVNATWELKLDQSYLISATWPLLFEICQLTHAIWDLQDDSCYLRSWHLLHVISKQTHATLEVDPCTMRSASRLMPPEMLTLPTWDLQV